MFHIFPEALMFPTFPLVCSNLTASERWNAIKAVTFADAMKGFWASGHCIHQTGNKIKLAPQTFPGCLLCLCQTEPTKRNAEKGTCTQLLTRQPWRSSQTREICKPVSRTQRRTVTEECPKSCLDPAAGSIVLPQVPTENSRGR